MPTIQHLDIDPERVYPEEELRKLGGVFSDRVLRKARTANRLKYSEPGDGRRVYLGAWLLAWLTRPPKEPRK